VPFRGSWVFEKPGNAALPHYRDHYLTTGSHSKCPYKYCVRPDSLIGSLPREVHGIGGMLANRLLASNSQKYWHFWSVSTKWKNHRKLPVDQPLTEDINLRDRLENLFPANENQDNK
jgi:hypothetical protein